MDGVTPPLLPRTRDMSPLCRPWLVAGPMGASPSAVRVHTRRKKRLRPGKKPLLRNNDPPPLPPLSSSPRHLTRPCACITAVVLCLLCFACCRLQRGLQSGASQAGAHAVQRRHSVHCGADVTGGRVGVRHPRRKPGVNRVFRVGAAEDLHAQH